MSKKSVMAWWFAVAPEDGVLRLPHGDGRVVEVGKTLTVDRPIIPCERGLHASVRAIDALQYAPGSFVCRVKCGGEVVHEHDKLACSERTVVWMADATNVLHRFAVETARSALKAERKRGREPHPDSWRVLDVKTAWLNGRATDADLSAARSAAGSAARSTAWSAARSAAESAAESAAWSAAESAAESAARSAAWSAAESAARSAAWSAAWSAAESAAKSAANRRLERMLNTLASGKKVRK